MLRLRLFSAFFVGLLVALVFFPGCDTDSQVSDLTEGECYLNNAPVLNDLYFLTRKVGDESFLPLGKPAFVRSDEEIQIKIEFEDEDCNLAEGLLFKRIDGGSWELVPPKLDENLGCSDLDEAGPISFQLDLNEFFPDDDYVVESEEEHNIQVRVSDRCESFSEALSADFKIIP